MLKKQENHKSGNSLKDVILGGQDGLVNALGIILGISAAGGDINILVATVLAATFAESLSMGAVAYTSALSQKDYYNSERAREAREVEKIPEIEKEELKRIYQKKGFEGRALEEIVQTISKDKKIWVDIMMTEELKIEPVDSRDILKSSVVVTIATTVGHLIPLLPFFFLRHQDSLIMAVIISALTLFAVGAYQALTLTGSWVKSGLRMVLIGLAAAFIGYFIARLFHLTTAG